MNNYLKLKRKKIIEVAFTIIVIFVGFFTSMKGIYGTEGDPEVLFNCALGAGGTTIECDVRLATGSESILSVNANYMALPTGLS